MCDHDRDDLGLVPYTGLTRRNFTALIAGAAAAGYAGGAQAQALEVIERDVDVPTPDGAADAALFTPAGNGRYPGVLILPDAGVFRPVFRDVGRRLAAQGYVVLAPNIHYRGGPAPTLVGAANAEARAKARATITDATFATDSKAYVAYLDRLAQTSNAKVGVHGYCLGAVLCFQTAAAVPNRVGAVGSFHGAQMVTDQPASPHRLIEKSEARYLIALSQDDDVKMPTMTPGLRESLIKSGNPGIVEVYAADHGWCLPDANQYLQSEAERAWTNLLGVYKASLV